MIQLHDCPACKKGKITVKVHQQGQQASSIEIDCGWCDGTGSVNDKRLAEHKAYQEMWCRCDDVGHDVKHYRDGEHPELLKHHYRHTVCGRVIQIG